MADNRLQVVIDLKDSLSASLNKVKQNLSGFKGTIERGTEASKTFAAGIGAAATALGGLGYFAIQAAGDAEQTRVAFETMLGSAEKAQKFIAELTNFAATTPFELKGLEQSAKQLLAYGTGADQIIPTLTALGNITAGIGADKLPQLILAFGQVQAATKLTGSELRQFTEAGVPLLGMLATQMDTTAGAIQEMVSDGAIGFEEVRKAIFAMSAEGGQFENLMQKQSKTFGGMVSNLKDSWDLFLRGQGQQLLEWAKKAVEGLMFIVTDVLPKMITKIQELTQFFRENKTALLIFAGALIGALTPAIFAAVSAMAAFAISLAPFVIGGAIIGGIVAGIMWIVQNWEMLKSKANDIWSSIKDTIVVKVSEIVTPVKDFFQSVYNTATDVFGKIQGFFVSVWDGIKMVFKFALSFLLGLVISYFNFFDINIVQVFTSISETVFNFWEKTKEVFFGSLTVLKEAITLGLELIKSVWVTMWTGLGNFFGAKWKEYSEKSAEGMNSVKEMIHKYTDPLVKAFNNIWELVKAGATWAMDGIKSLIKGTINFVIDMINKLIKAANKVAQAGAGALGLDIARIPEIPRLAKGGIVTKPTLAMIGEDGPEAVVPLNKKNAPAGMGGATINIIVHGDISGEDLIEKVGNELTKRLQLSTAIV